MVRPLRHIDNIFPVCIAPHFYENRFSPVIQITSCGSLCPASWIAKALGVDRKNLYRRKKDEKAVGDAIEKGRALGVAQKAKNMSQLADGRNLAANKFLLERLATDLYGPQKVEVEHSGGIEAPPAVEIKLSDTQLQIISSGLDDEFGGGYTCEKCGDPDCDMSCD